MTRAELRYATLALLSLFIAGLALGAAWSPRASARTVSTPALQAVMIGDAPRPQETRT